MIGKIVKMERLEERYGLTKAGGDEIRKNVENIKQAANKFYFYGNTKDLLEYKDHLAIDQGMFEIPSGVEILPSGKNIGNLLRLGVIKHADPPPMEVKWLTEYQDMDYRTGMDRDYNLYFVTKFGTFKRPLITPLIISKLVWLKLVKTGIIKTG